MRASRNELNSLFKQALEGCGLECGVYENAAESAVWSQMIGCDVLLAMPLSIEECLQNKLATIKLSEPDSSHCVVNVNGVSSLMWGGLVCNALEARAAQSEVFTATIEQVFDPRLLLMNFGRCSQNTSAVSVSWYDPHYNGLVCAQYSAENHWPKIELFSDSGNADKTSHVYLAFTNVANQGFNLHQDYWQCSAGAMTTIITPTQAQENYDIALQDGIEIPNSLWQQLLMLANRVLVENSEQSRKGAGA